MVVTTTVPTSEFNSRNIGAHSMQAGGSMAFPLARIKTYIIRLFIFWKVYSMIWYLHMISKSLYAGLFPNMVLHRDYMLIHDSHER